MRIVLPLLAALALAACANSSGGYVAPPHVVYASPAPDTVGRFARLRAEHEADLAREAAGRRRDQIVLGSRGTASITAARDTRLLDAPALTAGTLAAVDSGEVLQARSFDGRYWGVQRGEEWGYVPESAVVRNDDARRLVTEDSPAPARPTAPAARRTAAGRSTSGGSYSTVGGRARCADFSSRAEAQAAFDANPSAYTELDTDNDGRACENGVGSSSGRASSGGSGGGSGSGYTNSRGERVASPRRSASGPPAGASAQCRDGTYSFSRSRRGTCSHHGGVARWL